MNDHTQRCHVLVVYGTRPEIIKLAPVVFALRERPQKFEISICATGQQREMTDQTQALFGLEPDFDLDLMRPDQSLNSLLARSITAIDDLLNKIQADWILVQGDTTSVMASAVAAFHRGIKIGHVEAGLRTRDLHAPFPEEANRSLTDRLADLMFVPTEKARQNLLDEGQDPSRIRLTGNTVVDALHWICDGMDLEPDRNEVLVTVHRRENFGEPLVDILSAIRELAGRYRDLRWIYPVHRNPRVRQPTFEILGKVKNIDLCDPLPYGELIRVLRRCKLVLTDSGGLQEEAPTFGKPVLVLRDKTERPEGVDAGAAKLVGTRTSDIVAEVDRLLTDPRVYRQMAVARNPYGDGNAALRIVEALASRAPIDTNL